MSVITVSGNLTADPVLRFTASGAAVANFTIAHTPRKFNTQTQQYEDGEPTFLRCNVWREAAENAASSLSKGQRVLVTGRLEQRNYETAAGEKRQSFEVEVDDFGPSLRFASAVVTRNERRGGGNQSQQQAPRQQPQQQSQPQQQGGGDPWASASTDSSFADEPPF